KTPAKIAKAALLSVIFRLGNSYGRKAPPRRCPFRKPTASPRVRGLAALPPRQCRGKDVRPFLRMQLQHSYWAKASYDFIRGVASLWRALWCVSRVAGQECPGDKCSTTDQFRTNMPPNS